MQNLINSSSSLILKISVVITRTIGRHTRGAIRKIKTEAISKSLLLSQGAKIIIKQINLINNNKIFFT